MRSYHFYYDRDDSEPLMLGSAGGRPVETASMSRGEIWVHYVLAYAVRVSNAGPLMLDEPESLLAPRGHQPFIDEIARTTLAAKQQLIVATHSLQAMSRFSLQATRLCVGTADGVQLVTPASRVEVRDALGYESALLLLVLVEDAFAQAVLEMLIAQFSPHLVRVIEIKSSGGASPATSTLVILSGLVRIRAVAVLDGDERDRHQPQPYLFFLPGTNGPEDELVAAVGRHVELFAGQLDRSARDVLVALDTLQGSSHQRLPRALAKAIGRTEPVVVRAMVDCWLSEEAVRQHSRELVSSLEELVKWEE